MNWLTNTKLKNLVKDWFKTKDEFKQNKGSFKPH